jgi:hypothetical protein
MIGLFTALARTPQVLRMFPGRLRRFAEQPKPRRILFVEACLYLICARLLLRFLPFRRLTWLFSIPLGKTVLSSADREQLRQDVCWAIARASDFLPGETVCFPRGIAAQIMCRKGGIDTIMYYGGVLDPLAGLTAHVWVQDGPIGIVGHIVAGQYGVLARFPA